LLVTALRVIVVQEVAGHVLEGALARHVPSALADDERELDLEVRVLRPTRQLEPVEGAALRRRRLHEHDRLFRNGRSGLLRVAAIVEADAHELARAGDGRSDACVGRYAGQARGL